MYVGVGGITLKRNVKTVKSFHKKRLFVLSCYPSPCNVLLLALTLIVADESQSLDSLLSAGVLSIRVNKS